MAREHTYRWEWRFPVRPEQLWPLVADTDRFDRDAGVPELEPLLVDATLGPGTTRQRVRQYGVALDYVQEPFEWVEPEHFGVVRHFATGPLTRLAIRADLLPSDDGAGTVLRYTVRATPRRRLYRPALTIQIGLLLSRRFEATFREYAALAERGDTAVATGRRPRLAAAGAARLEDQRHHLAAAGVPTLLAEHLLELVRAGDETAVGRMRPYRLAAAWGTDRRQTLEAFLVATRTGLLQLRWEVLCPVCRVTKAAVGTLADLPTSVHCDACTIDYDANFAQSVELTFQPVPAIRSVHHAVHCVGNPAATPHILHQQLVEPGTAIDLVPGPAPGRYRVRTVGRPGAAYVRVGPGPAPAGTGGPPVGTLDCSTWAEEELQIRAGDRVTVENTTGAQVLVVLERTAAGDDAVTAAQVTAMQRFRDLFADEALRPTEQIEVGSLTVVFTDLCDSTAMYREIGDAVAFGRVLDHFDVLRRTVDERGGAVVKTIGDAVMAVFPSPDAAVGAMLEAQTAMSELPAAGGRHLVLKAGIHHGPCIAVTLNGQLDYFGSTVNLAARLQGQAGGGGIVLSEAVAGDPAVSALVAGWPRPVDTTSATVLLKGFAEPVAMQELQVGADGPGATPDLGATAPARR